MLPLCFLLVSASIAPLSCFNTCMIEAFGMGQPVLPSAVRQRLKGGAFIFRQRGLTAIPLASRFVPV